jgi:hypothetical protein
MVHVGDHCRLCLARLDLNSYICHVTLYKRQSDWIESCWVESTAEWKILSDLAVNSGHVSEFSL